MPEIDRLIGKLEAFPVISFDVFDTLLMRVVWQPEDVFRLVARRIGDDAFVKARIVAERQARARAGRQDGHEDITIDEIYAGSTIEAGRPVELEIEKSVCVANPELWPVFEQARRLGKRIVALSDMYLPPAFVRELLENAGFEGIDALYLSSETRQTKASGRLFAHMLSELELAPQDVLHIGDNHHADVVAPGRLGIEAVHYPPPRTRALQTGRVNPAVVRALTNSPDIEASVLAGLAVRDSLRPRHAADYWRDIGHHIAGPLAYAFTAWIARRAEELDLSGLFFLSRDGLLPWHIYRTYFTGVDARYIYASRRMSLIAAIETLDDETLRHLTSGEINAPAREYFERLDIGVPDGLDRDLAAQFGDPRRPIGSRDQIERLGELFRKHQDWLKRAAAGERDSLLAYLKSVGFMDAGRKAIVDIGWNGSSQRFLEKLPVDSRNLFGLYLGLSERGYVNERNEGFAFTYGVPSKRYTNVFKCAEFFELLFSAGHYAVARIERRDGRFEPRFEARNRHEDERVRIAERIHAGALAFCEDYVELAGKLKLGELTPDLAMAPADALLSKPTDLDIRMIGNVHHSKGLGSAHYHPIVAPDRMSPANWLYFLVGGKDMHRFMSYWAIGARHKHKAFRKYDLLGVIFERTLWLPPKIKKARMLGARATLSAVAKIVRRRWLQI